jgi:hypothetical protein
MSLIERSIGTASCSIERNADAPDSGRGVARRISILHGERRAGIARNG